ncbi:lysis system i-spanin subunit Rz [Pseudomonas moorei]|uniref:lysis system i-spanin subunit Rz n=1 Tax=Pseudomonas moorei TaxID=395599 RepID=UPI0020104702|nr:lysis system i-spanin subunit Rz [Pseudomonas moorei]
MTLVWRMVGMAALVSLGACGAWEWQAIRYAAEISHIRARATTDEAQRARTANEAIILEQHRNRQLTQAITQLEQQRYQEIKHVQDTAQRLTLELSAARQRLSVRIAGPVCDGGMQPASSSRALGDATYTTELHPAVAADLAALAADADECAVKLAYLQQRERFFEKRRAHE